MKTRLCLLAVAVLLCGCTRTDHAQRVLESQGYTGIETTGYRWTTCGNDDTFSTGFKAFAPDGKRRVSGAVCEGWFKGATVRLD